MRLFGEKKNGHRKWHSKAAPVFANILSKGVQKPARSNDKVAMTAIHFNDKVV